MNDNTQHDIASKSSGQPAVAVEVRDLRKTFPGVVAVDNVSFSVHAGEVFCLLGPNGAGKTTTLECLAGALTPDSGRIEVLGLDPVRHRQLVRERVGYQLQSAVLPDTLRVEEALRLFASFYPVPVAVEDLLRTVGLAGQRKRAFGKLSGGEKQRLSIALALVGSPQIVVLDELTTGLDPQGRRSVWHLIDQIKGAGVTIILVSHYLDEVQRLADRLAIVVAGRTQFVGTPTELRAAASAASGAVQSLEDAYLDFLDRIDPTTTGRAA
ncbi:MAG: ABC transporter ATP-binding protein [Arachnia sp.]